MKEIPVQDVSLQETFQKYQVKFKALADERRLQMMYEITQQKELCVCDLSEKMNLPQSKLSYHLKILLDASLIKKDTRGTWSYYSLDEEQVNHLLSEELCCLFRHN